MRSSAWADERRVLACNRCTRVPNQGNIVCPLFAKCSLCKDGHLASLQSGISERRCVTRSVHGITTSIFAVTAEAQPFPWLYGLFIIATPRLQPMRCRALLLRPSKHPRPCGGIRTNCGKKERSTSTLATRGDRLQCERPREWIDGMYHLVKLMASSANVADTR